MITNRSRTDSSRVRASRGPGEGGRRRRRHGGPPPDRAAVRYGGRGEPDSGRCVPARMTASARHRSPPPAPSTARPAVVADAGEQLRRRRALDDPVADPRKAVRVGDAGDGGGQRLAAAASNLRAARRQSSARSSSRPCSMPCARPCSSTRGSIPARSLPASSAPPRHAPKMSSTEKSSSGTLADTIWSPRCRTRRLAYPSGPGSVWTVTAPASTSTSHISGTPDLA